MLWHWFLHVTGSDNVSGPWYGFWSGFGSDIAEFGLLYGLYVLVRKHNCHARGCLRIGLHHVDGTPYVVCRKHHPLHKGSKAATAEEIADMHRDNNI